LTVERSGGRPRTVNKPGGRLNPGIEVEITDARGVKTVRYVLQRPPMHPTPKPPVLMHYVAAEPTGAVADESSGLPAMKVRVTWKGKSNERWLLAGPASPDHTSVLVVGRPFGSAPTTRPAKYTLLKLRFSRPRTGPIKDFKSHIVVLEEGNVVAEKVIEVNDPLHYGGYHVYQYGWDKKGEGFTDLLVRSDAGLSLVHLGFAVLGGGVLWWAWGRPVVRLLAGRRRHGG
jgi:hypothetical protein